MIRRVEGDMFASDADVLVVPVNCVGVRGAGVARVARSRYPDACAAYATACKGLVLIPGSVLLVDHENGAGPAIAFAATKDHWRDPSRLEWVERCLARLAETLIEVGARTAAVPALGCGLGGLAWADVLSLMERHLGPITTECLIYAPHGGAS